MFRTAMVPILTLILCLSQTALTFGFQSFAKLQLPSTGSESYAFDSNNVGPYTALNDGRIVKFIRDKNAFVDFATTTSNRSKELCDGTGGYEYNTSITCGRPIALEFNRRTKEFYIIDAYLGLMVVGMNGGVATPLTPNTHFYFGDAIDIDPVTGVVYITDLGNISYRFSTLTAGSLLKYDPRTKRCDVILRGLAMPGGVAVSKDGSFLLISEYSKCNVTRLWLDGPKANTTETFVELPGSPDNIKRTISGDFWVAVNIKRVFPTASVFPVGQRISATGQILETVNFYGEYNATYVMEVQKHRSTYYVASQYTDFVGVYRRLKCRK